MDQGPTDVALEDDNDNQDDRGEKIIENPVQGIKLPDLGRDVDEQDDGQTEQHLYRPRSFDQQEDTIDNKRDQRDIEQVEQPSEIYAIEDLVHISSFTQISGEPPCPIAQAILATSREAATS